MELTDRQKEIIAQAKASSVSAPSTAQVKTPAPQQEMGIIESIAERAKMNLTDPERMKAKLRVLGQGALFGGADEAEAAARSMFSDKTYEEELANIRQEMEQFKKDDPTTAITGEILGAVASPAGLIKAPAMLAKLGNTGQAVARSGAGGAAYGFGTGEGGVEQRLEKAKEMGLTGAAIGGVAQKVVAPLVQAAGTKLKQAADNPIERLRSVAQQSWKAADDEGFKIVSGSLRGAVDDAKNAASSGRGAYNPNLPAHKDAADTYKFVDDMIEDSVKTGKPLNLTTLDQIRKNISDSALMANPTSKPFILSLRDKVDDLIDDTLGGTGDNVYKTARNNWRNLIKAETVAEAVEKGISAAKTSGSGGNIQNTLRQAIKSVYQNKRNQKVFSQKELAQLKKFAEGSMDENILRAIGKLSPTAGSLMGVLHAGAAGASGFSSVPLQLGLVGAKTLGDVSKMAQSRRLVEAVGGMRPSMARPFQELLPNRAVLPATIETSGLLGD